MPIPSFALILTAAGTSERFNRDNKQAPVKKEFLSLEDGKSILYHAALPFFEIGSLAAIIITHEKDALDETVVALDDLMDCNTIPMLFSPGGKTRQESIRGALAMLEDIHLDIPYVAIQDGARPYLTTELAITVFANATIHSGAVPALPLTDSVKKIDKEGNIISSPRRSELVSVQTPQFFDRVKLIEAYNKCMDANATDDSEIFTNAGFSCIAVPGDENNSKITYLSDIPNADAQISAYLEAREKGRNSRKAVRRFNELIAKGEGE